MKLAVSMPMFWVGGLMMSLLAELGGWRDGPLCTEGTSTSSRFAMGSVLAEDDMKIMPRSADRSGRWV